MLFHNFSMISWSLRKAQRFFNLFISINPDRSIYGSHPSRRYSDRLKQHPEDTVGTSRVETVNEDTHDPLASEDIPSAMVGLPGGTRNASDTGLALDIHGLESPEPRFAFPRRHPGSPSSPSLDSPLRVLRSSRQRKYRSVSDTATEIQKAKERISENTSLRLRRTNRCVSWPMTRDVEDDDPSPQRTTSASLYTPHLEEPTSYPDNWHSSYVTAPTTHTNEALSSGYSHYVTARNTFDCTLDSIDEDSVVDFFNPTASRVTQPPYESEVLPWSGPEDCFSVLPESPVGYLGDTSQFPIPAVMLTLPTPTVPLSPVFLTQSPITISKYLTASSASLISPGPLSDGPPLGAPTLPNCDYCGLAEFENGTQCAECDQQWLACKIWYYANDGGRKRYLKEPFIKPAESTARTRALLDLLGVPGGTPGPLGLGIEFETETPRKRRFWRISRLLSSVPMTDRLVSSQARLGLENPSGSLVRNLLMKTTASLGRVRMKIAGFLVPGEECIGGNEMREMEEEDGTESSESVGSSCRLAPGIPRFGLGEELDVPVLRAGCAESRFVEHLAGHFGSMVVCV
ncbi:hypothetical protein BXZ70DRAFT_908840 [Cristinia sonorae]|uniref:Uncharacterized protein n=1 Tax=Cristinia sonorae TaxID=1940300 RepID=A0A8K0UKQ5_9AGAR|nr:hypothetical protein BXZ70DRAFT_908840 [Cristinia sonorae]